MITRMFSQVGIVVQRRVLKSALRGIGRRAAALALASALTVGAIGFGAPSVHAFPISGEDAPDSCSLTINGKKVYFAHGTIIKDRQGNKYQCNDGKWEKVSEKPAVTTRGITLGRTALGAFTPSPAGSDEGGITAGADGIVVLDGVGASNGLLPYNEQDNPYKVREAASRVVSTNSLMQVQAVR